VLLGVNAAAKIQSVMNLYFKTAQNTNDHDLEYMEKDTLEHWQMMYGGGVGGGAGGTDMCMTFRICDSVCG
jgi:hypothetical protein